MEVNDVGKGSHKHFEDARLDSRFWPKVAIGLPGECWLWTASVGGPGYGQINFQGIPATAHRLVYELYFGPIPPGKFVLHKCDIRRCCSPEHLFLGTPADNVADMIGKGRQRRVAPEKYAAGESHGRHKLTAQQVREIREIYASGESTQVELGKRYGVSGAHVCGIVSGKFWKEDMPALS